MDFRPNFLPVAIGSVPHKDANEAVKFMMKYFPTAPCWPQLPARGDSEGFINQFLRPLKSLGLIKEKGNKCYFDTEQEDLAIKLAEFYELYMAAEAGDEQALNYFAFSPDSAQGFYAYVEYLKQNGTGEAKYLKGQLSGPISIGIGLTDQNLRATYYDLQCRDVLIKTIALQGLHQAKVLSQFGLPVLIFVDDPGLYAVGQSTFITIKKDEVREELNSIYDLIKTSGATVGTHSCSGMDWSILFESNADIVSFDAFGYFNTVSGYSEEMRSFLNRGGSLAWGIVPTAPEYAGQQSPEELEVLWEERMIYMEGKGFSRELLARQALISPSCGTGTLTLEQAEKVSYTTFELAERLRK